MRWVAPAVWTAVMTVGFVALAQPSSGSSAGVELAWTAPVECPSRAAVLGEVRAILEGSAASTHAVEAAARVERAGPRWRVALTIRSDQGSGVRSLEADSCEALASAIALIVALAVDPTRRAAAAPDDAGPPSADAQTAERSPADAGASTPAPAPLPPRPRPADRGEEAVDGPRLALGAMGATDVGDLPSAALGGSLAVAGLYRRGRLEVRGRTFVSQRAADLARPTQGVDLAYLGLDARACFAVLATGRASREGFAVSPCLGVDLSRITGSGFGGPKTFSGDGSWSAFEPGLLGTWALASSVALRVGVDLLVPTSRPGFVVLAPDGSTAESLHRPAPIAGRIDLGAELRFW